ncbi:hypothetical protein FRC02_011719 [Tulasnella sp. 418]|nr:hypothetical protein FRC02_011719 [Tulasnella sp. 418]
MGFTHVLGTDPSHKMIDQANAELLKDRVDDEQIKYTVLRAEEVDSFLARKSVGLITAGVAAHWFDQSRVWPGLSTVLAPGGTIAFWVSGYLHLRQPN